MRDLNIKPAACQDVHFTSIEDIDLKSSILGQSSTLRVSGKQAIGKLPKIKAGPEMALPYNRNLRKITISFEA
jgi:hypothetical protein